MKNLRKAKCSKMIQALRFTSLYPSFCLVFRNLIEKTFFQPLKQVNLACKKAGRRDDRVNSCTQKGLEPHGLFHNGRVFSPIYLELNNTLTSLVLPQTWKHAACGRRLTSGSNPLGLMNEYFSAKNSQFFTVSLSLGILFGT